jgi:hypothetical protein
MTNRTSRESPHLPDGKETLVEVAETVASEVVIGQDILELVSSGMYVDPFAIYREYVQNAADSIDEARREGLLSLNQAGCIDVNIEAAARTVRIRDNGTGLGWSKFVRTLTAIGASRKRGRGERGFRGVGRLAGLGYAHYLTFRSRTEAEDLVSELTWDCLALRTAFRESQPNEDLRHLVGRVVAARRVKADDYPRRFFEVELRGVVRLGSDKLINPQTIADYLAQIGPVPFRPDFAFASQIQIALQPVGSLGDLNISISGVEGQIRRPHRAGTSKAGGELAFTDVEIFEIPGMTGGIAAIGWILHHDYSGSLPNSSLVKGLRLRSGNIQIGGDSLLDGLFAESRFNSWCVGEIHIVDPRIVPNARRDNFEQNAHYANLINYLTPIARAISRRCRVASRSRKIVKEFEEQTRSVRDRLSILAAGGLGNSGRAMQVVAIEQTLQSMNRRVDSDEFPGELVTAKNVLASLRKQAQDLCAVPSENNPLSVLPAEQRSVYEHLFGLIYACSGNLNAARALVEKLIFRLREDADAPSDFRTDSVI